MKYTIDKPIRLIELFAGVGSQAMALRDLGADFEHYRAVEFDKYPMASYNAIHGTNFQPTDITKITGADLGIVDTDKYTYLLTYSFPCQDLSIAGKGKGMAKGSGTRSGLLWEVERLLDETDELPQVLVMENVPQVHSKKNMPDFQSWLDFLESKGYRTFWQDINARNYVAQNRNRCFAVSILGDYEYEFPTAPEPTKALADYLESTVDEKYYLSEKCIEGFLKHNENHLNKGTGFVWKPKEVDEEASCLRACYSKLAATDTTIKEPCIQKIGNIYGHTGGSYAGNVYSPDGECPALNSMGGGNRQPMIPVKETISFTRNGHCKNTDEANTLTANNPTRTLGNNNPITAVLEPINPETDGNCRTIKAQYYKTSPANYERTGTMGATGVMDGFRIRKLTPKECWRLMTFSDSDFQKAAAVNSNTRLYQQAGNSIVKDVLMAIFSQMLLKKSKAELLKTRCLELLNEGRK